MRTCTIESGGVKAETLQSPRRTRNKMERTLCISLLVQARRMPGVAARLQPATQSKLLTRHFLHQHLDVCAHVSTCPSEIRISGEFCEAHSVLCRFLCIFLRAASSHFLIEYGESGYHYIWPLPPLPKLPSGFHDHSGPSLEFSDEIR